MSGSSGTNGRNDALSEFEAVYLRPKRSIRTHIRPKLTDANDVQISRQKRSDEGINEIFENQNGRSRPKRSKIPEENLLLRNTLRSDVTSRLLERTEAEVRQQKKRFLSNTASLRKLCETNGGSTDSLRLLCKTIGYGNVDNRGWGNPALPPID